MTGDISGMFKVWDARTFNCVQNFNVATNDVTNFCLSGPIRRIIISSKKLVFYDYDEPKDYHLADETACVCALYNNLFHIFITAHSSCIKLWSALTGNIVNIYRDLTSSDITMVCTDDRKRKLFIGDSEGKIFSINIKNGAKMKTFKPHDSEIS